MALRLGSPLAYVLGAMDRNEREVQEIDRLVSKLTTSPQAPQQTSSPNGQPSAGSRWTNVTMRMPSPRTVGFGSRVMDQVEALGGWLELGFEQLGSYIPDVRRVLKVPRLVTLVRMWVALAAAYGAAMTFWPYPKTYFWGLIAYQLCLGLSLVAGVWGARLSWDARLGAAHTLALGTILWAATLGTTHTVTVVRGGTWFETPTFAYSTLPPTQRPAAPVSGLAPASRNRRAPVSAAPAG